MITRDQLVAALALPAAARVQRRVPKTLLIAHGAPTAGDRRHIESGIEELQWLAVLKPANCGVPVARAEDGAMSEIALLALHLRPGARPAHAHRLGALVHRAVPYGVLLVVSQDDTVSLSLAPKRVSQAEVGRMVLLGEPAVCTLGNADNKAAQLIEAQWLAGLALAAQPRTDMNALYNGWLARVEALNAARLSGRLHIFAGAAQCEARRSALGVLLALRREIKALRAAAAKEKLMARRIDINVQLKQLQHRLDDALAQL